MVNMEDVLELVDRKQSICITNLPPGCSKDQLKNALTEEGCNVKNVVICSQDKTPMQAVVQMENPRGE